MRGRLAGLRLCSLAVVPGGRGAAAGAVRHDDPSVLWQGEPSAALSRPLIWRGTDDCGPGGAATLDAEVNGDMETRTYRTVDVSLHGEGVYRPTRRRDYLCCDSEDQRRRRVNELVRQHRERVEREMRERGSHERIEGDGALIRCTGCDNETLAGQTGDNSAHGPRRWLRLAEWWVCPECQKRAAVA